MAHQGYQLTEFLYGLGAGRRRLPRLPDPVVATPSRAPDGPGAPEGSDEPTTGGALGSVGRVLAGFGSLAPVQTDPTTCGSASLVVLAAAGDPRLRAWLVGGTALDGIDPPELTWLDAASRAAVESGSAQERFGALQHAAKRRSNRRALLGLRWPAGLGTPPWGAARVARYGSIRYTHRIVADTSPRQSRTVLEHAVAAAGRGFPVLLYTGGDTRGGPAAAVPRHVVVLHCRSDGSLALYEPSRGADHLTTLDDLLDGGTPRASLGGWSHVVWAVLPRA